MSKLMEVDVEYRKWISELSNRFRRSQVKAAIKVNSEMLRFYWSLGRDIVELSDKNCYGSDFYRTISSDLKDIFPDVKSFSPTNLKYMRYFYEMYPDVLDNRQQLVDGFGAGENRQQPVDDLETVFQIPWGHHVQILGKCKGRPDKAFFYVKKTLENNWSRAVLLNFLDTNLYEREGKAISNFASTLPTVDSDLAQAITKDPYNFDFLSIREKYDEKELKEALMDNFEKFLLELGNGFAYVGREVRLDMGDSDEYMDMLFYNIRLHCYVVVEIKVKEFQPKDMGQLSTYMVAVNHQLKKESDAPTLGIIICKSKNDVKAKYALEASSQPMGISEYSIDEFLPEDYKSSLPSIEEIEAELAGVMDEKSEGEQNS